VGLSIESAHEVLDKRTFTAAVYEEWRLSREYGNIRVSHA